MWSALAFASADIGIIALIIGTQETSYIGVTIGLIMLIIGGPTFLALDYYNTEITYKVEMQTQEVLSENGKDYAIRLRIYREGKYYDIEMSINKYHGETELTFTRAELLKYRQ